jgi:hypothetical protein
MLAVLVGAGCGALLVLHESPAAALGLGVFLMAAVLLAASVAASNEAEWQK